MKSLWHRLRWWLAVIVAGAVLLSRAAWWRTDYLWFASLGQTRVFTTLLGAKALLFVVFAVAGYLLVGHGLVRSRRLDTVPSWAVRDDGAPYWGTLLWSGLPLLAVLFAVGAGWWATRLWNPLLLLLHAAPTGLTEPAFGRDVGDWMMRLPFWVAAQRALLMLALGGWVALYLRYVEVPASTEELSLQSAPKLSEPARRHLAAHGAIVFALWAWGFLLGRAMLVVTSRTPVLWGIGWTDAQVRLPILAGLAGAALLAAAGCILTARGGPTRRLLWIVGAFVLLQVVATVVPAVAQRLVVLPSESAREAPYIARCIEATRRALGLESARVEQYDVAGKLDAGTLAGYDEVLSTVPLWSPAEISEQIVATQALRSYYNVTVADYDRYTIDGRRQQVAILAREMQIDRLDAKARTWVNRHLVFTHGYGLIVASAHELGEAGKPVTLMRDLPPRGPADLPLTRPEIYYGEIPSDYIITGLRPDAGVAELDYPRGDTNVTTVYAGRGGVPMGGLFRRLAFAWRFRSLNVLFTDLLTRDSRVHFRRDVMSRLQALAPFLVFDSDPYPAVVDGRVVWVVDAYTTSAMYPYSQPQPVVPAAALAMPQGDRLKSADAAYIRNSVKAVVDAYDGTVTLYRTGDDCPLLAAWTRAFPGLIAAEPAPASLARQFRYPGDLFTLQARAFARFHMTDVGVFYNAEDLWDLAREETTTRLPRPDGTYQFESSRERMVPYYVLLRLPGEAEAKFRLIVPFTPAGAGEGTTGRDNMIGWMAADCDPDSYGRLTVYQFPKGELVWGPLLVEAQIDQDPDISQQITLWGEQGSRVLRGRLLVVPLGDTLLFIEPLFITAERRGALPELKRVAVYYDGTVRMAETLPKALEAVLSGRRSQLGSAEAERLRQRLEQLRDAWREADQRRRQGDLVGYGETLEQLERLLEPTVLPPAAGGDG